MAYVHAGSIVTVVLGGHDRLVQVSPGTVCARVNAYLVQTRAALSVRTCRTQTPSWVSTAVLTGILTNSYPYTGTWDVQPSIDFAREDDVASILANAAYEVTGYYPSEVSAAFVDRRPTGQPVPGSPDTVLDLGRSVSNLGGFLENVTGSLSAVLVLIVVVAIVIALAIYGPTARRVLS